MKYILRILAGILLLLIIGAGSALGYLFIKFPSAGKPPDILLTNTPEELERGKYLAEHVTLCLDCHSTRNFKYYSGPIVAGTEGQGGLFGEAPVGKIYAPNITPYALRDWSDREIARAIAAGVSRDGSPLFPIMPYHEYSHLSEKDLQSIIAYIRTLDPIQNDVPRSELNFPMNLIVRTIPKPYTPKPEPAEKERGAYLATIGNCLNCHTPIDDRGQKIESLSLAGGFEFPLPGDSIVRSVNITPDEETGIGKWSKEKFIDTFKRFENPDASRIMIEGKENTVMPWAQFAGMTEEDLGLVYDYLRTVKPVRHQVQKFPGLTTASK